MALAESASIRPEPPTTPDVPRWVRALREQRPPTALRDPVRLAAVVATGLVPSAGEAGGGAPGGADPAAAPVAFARVADLAARVLRAPVAQVSLVTADVQQPLAASAAEPDLARWTAPIGVDASFCQYVVAADRPLLIEDAREHPLVRDSAATTEGGVVAYAGVPLRAPGAGGTVLGTVCVVDFVPRAWEPADLAALEQLAAFVTDALVARAAARTQATAADSRLRQLVETSSVGLVVGDPAGRLVYFNPAAHALLGYTPEEVAAGSVRWGAITPPEYAARDAAAVEALLTIGTCAPYEKAFVRRDGRTVPVLVSATLLSAEHGDGEATVAAFVVDRSAQHAAEAERERLLATAEAARAEAERLRALAEAANRAKSEFLAVMSHELRTPLNAIGGYADLLDLGLRGPVTEAQHADLARIRSSGRHLLSLINEVLNFAKLEAGQVAFAVTDVALAPVLAGVEALLAPQAGARGLALDVVPCAPTLRVRADGEKLAQVLVNLLSNAVKFTDPPGCVSVRCEAAPDAGADGTPGVVRVHVVDTGIGIPADKLAAIFEPFVQVRAGRTRTHEGTGLGLAISRDLARGMGGELTVTSAPGEGSTFTLTLPRAADGVRAVDAGAAGAGAAGAGACDAGAGDAGAGDAGAGDARAGDARAGDAIGPAAGSPRPIRTPTARMPSRAEVAAVVDQVHALLADGIGAPAVHARSAVHAVLALLNARVTHRHTGLYRLDGATLRNVALFDRAEPSCRVGPDAPLGETYCSIVGATGRPFATADTGVDARLMEHPARETVQSYCGAVVRDARGAPAGTLCHFDLAPQPVPAAEIPILEAVAPLLAAAVARHAAEVAPAG